MLRRPEVRVLRHSGSSIAVRLRRFACLFTVSVLTIPIILVGGGVPSANALSASPRWIATWGASPQAEVPGTLSSVGFHDETVRDIVYTSVGGTSARVRFTNVFGRRPLEIGRAAIGVGITEPGLATESGAALSFGQSTAVLSNAGLAPHTDVPLSFDGRPSVVIPPGDEALSDPADIKVRPLETLAVSVYLPRSTGPATWHADAQQVNFVAPGDRTLDAGVAAFTTTTRSWYFVDGVEVTRTDNELGTIVAFGDSITDGSQSSEDENERWPNDLARRLDALSGPTLSIVDEGIAGNRVLNASAGYGASALERFNRDVIDQPGARDVILLEGINDIQFSRDTTSLTAPHTNVSADQIIAGYRQLIAKAHAAGLKIFGATLTPDEGSKSASAAGEAKRQAVNHWILTSGAFDGVIDFAKALADPTDPSRMNPIFDSGDHLHPNDAGYRAMANAIDLAMFGACNPCSGS